MGYAKYIGRVGGLAVALGVGIAVATTPGVAWADDTGSAGSGDTTGTAGATGASGTSESEGSSTTTGTTTGATGASTVGGSQTDGAPAPGSGAVDASQTSTSASTDASVRQVPPGMVLATGGADSSSKSSSQSPATGDVDAESTLDDSTPPKRVADSTATEPEAPATAKAPVSGRKGGSDKRQRPVDEPTGAPGLDASAVTATGGAPPSRPQPSGLAGTVVNVAVHQPAAPQAVTAAAARTFSAPQTGVVARQAISAAPAEPTPPGSPVSGVVLGVLASLGPLATNGPLTPVDSPVGLALMAVGARRQFGQAVAEETASLSSSPTLTSQSADTVATADQKTFTAAATPTGQSLDQQVSGAPVGFAAAAAVNTAPTASPTQGAPNQATGAITGAINGADGDGNTLSYTLTGTPPASGSVSVNPQTGTFTYTPSQLARFAAHDMGSGPDFDSFTVAVSDGQVSTPVMVKVAVLPALIPSIGTTAQTGATPMGMAVSPTKTYVANQSPNTVSVIDRANPTAAPVTIKVVSSPRAIALSPDSTRAYVAGNGGVSVINTANNQVITTVSTTAGDSYGIAVVQTGVNTHRVYVTNAANNTVRVLNTNTLTNTYTAGGSVQVGSTPRGIAVSADGTRAYVANWASNSVSVLNTTTTTPTLVGSPITVGTNPFGVAVSPDGTRVYVSNNGSASVSVINTTTPTPTVSSVAVGSQPFGLAISPDGSIVYAANGPDTVSMIATKTNTVYSTLIIDSQPESQWHSVAVSPDGRQVYVSDLADRRVRTATIIRGNTTPIAGTPTVGGPAASNGAVTGALNFTDTDGDALTYSVQIQSASGTVTVNAAGVYTYTPNQAARDAAAQTEGPDFTSFTVVASDGPLATPVTVGNVQIAPTPRQPQIPLTMTSIGVGDKPGPVAVFGNRLYVTNTSDGTVTVVNTTTNQVVQTLTATGGYPTALAAKADGQSVYVAHSVLYPTGEAFNTVSVINAATNQVVTDVRIPDLCAGVCYGSSGGLTDLAISPDGSRVYVIQAYATDIGPWGSVAVIDTSDNSLIYNEFSSYVSDLEYTSDGTQLIYTQGDYRFVHISDFSTGQTPVAVVSTPDGGWAIPLAVGIRPDSKRAYVVVDSEQWDYTGAKYVAVIDLDRTSPSYAIQIASIAVAPGADNIVVGPDGRAYVAHNGGESVTVIDTATDTVIGYIATSHIGGYYALTVAPNGNVYMTDYADDVVYAVTVANPPQV